MRISNAGLDLIKMAESYLRKQPDGSCKAYQCPAGVWTCGWGCTSGVGPNTRWTLKEATEALAREMATHEGNVLRLVKVPLTQGQFDALVSLCYNIGAGNLGKSTLLKHLNAGDFARAASHFADFKKARVTGVTSQRMGVPDGTLATLPGLVKRRAAEMALFLSDTPEADAEMPQKVEKERTKLGVGETAAKVGVPAVAAGGVGISAAKEAVEQGKQIKEIAVDAKGLLPGVPKGMAIPLFGSAAIIAVVIGVVILTRRK